jgi:hypothetical protein
VIANIGGEEPDFPKRRKAIHGPPQPMPRQHGHLKCHWLRNVIKDDFGGKLPSGHPFRPDIRPRPHLPYGCGFTRRRIFTDRQRDKKSVRMDAHVRADASPSPLPPSLPSPSLPSPSLPSPSLPSPSLPSPSLPSPSLPSPLSPLPSPRSPLLSVRTRK